MYEESGSHICNYSIMLGDYLFAIRLNRKSERGREWARKNVLFIAKNVCNFHFFYHCSSTLSHLKSRSWMWCECWWKKLSLSFRNEYSWFVRQRYLPMSLILFFFHFSSLLHFPTIRTTEKRLWALNICRCGRKITSQTLSLQFVKFMLSCKKTFFYSAI